MRLNQEQVDRSKQLIDSAKQIVITSHKSPDGDAVGSAMALFLLLKKLQKNVVIVLPDEVPSFLQWIKGYGDILLFDENEAAAKNAIASAALIFSLDYNHLGRTGTAMEKALKGTTADFILIDHHHEPEDFAEVLYSDTGICSTAQMIWYFIDRCGWRALLDEDIASCIYCGIMTDSGSFRFPSVTADTHRIVAELFATGMDHARIHREVYDTNLPDRMRLIGFALSEKLAVVPECSVAYITLTLDEMKQFNYRPGDTEGLVNQALSINGIKMAAFFREGANEIKASFRSKGGFDVNTFARRSWNGGGHFNAAGGSSVETMEEAVKRFLKETERQCEEINRS
ncbi:MAG: bifunctional oligoribonuclease/PAP phosphatase NrnA [Crocinitomicaceae bacterium]|nr:bifunctional oligoribonuclease/PAP phosphatase NrnA [Crocinitomicaceae bacterium]